MSLNRGIYILWLMCLLVFNHTCGGQVELSVQSTGYPPHLYKDEPIAITCTANWSTEAELVAITTTSTTSLGCFYSNVFGWKASGSADDFPWLNGIDNAGCNATGVETGGAQDPPFILSLEGQVTESLVGLNLSCKAALDGLAVFSADSLFVSEIRVVPPGPPTLTISGDQSKIVEGNEFNFSCNSSGASPRSEYSYEVLRNGVIAASTGVYTPIQADRGGITLRCTDIVHEGLKDRYPERVVREMELRPLFLANNGEDTRTVLLNPAGDNTLTCDVIGNPEEQITYSWSCDGCRSTDTAQVVIPEASRNVGDVETISCTANLPSLSPVTIRWSVTWSSDATLPPISTTAANVGAGIAGLSGGVIAAICVGVVILASG